MSARKHRTCPFCHSPTNKLQAALFANNRVQEQQKALQKEQDRCQKQRQRLLNALQHQEAQQDLFRKVSAAEQRLRQASINRTRLLQQVTEARAQLSVGRGRLERKRAHLPERPQALESLRQKCEDAARELSNHKKAHAMAAHSLADRQAMEMKALQDVLPVRVSGVKANTRQPMQVSIANIRLPEVPSKAPLLLLSRDAESPSAALGYLTLQLRLLARILDAPLLHEEQYSGLHTTVWQATEFRSARAPPHELRFLLSGLPPESLPSSFIASSPATWTSVMSLETPDHVKQASGLTQGVRLLLRSAACASQHYMAQHSGTLPMHWSPFAWLVLVAEQVQGCRHKPQGSAWGLVTGQKPGEAGASPVEVHEAFFDHDHDREDDSEWSLVQSPGEVLPPPPSEKVDLEHWERAMFRDRQERMDRPPISSILSMRWRQS